MNIDFNAATQDSNKIYMGEDIIIVNTKNGMMQILTPKDMYFTDSDEKWHSMRELNGVDFELKDIITKIKAEAYKECIEKVKEELKNIAKIEWQDNYYYLVGTAFFDNLLNEWVGETK